MQHYTQRIHISVQRLLNLRASNVVLSPYLAPWHAARDRMAASAA